MEPISYANGSHINDPAITYGIVFSNFMSKGVFTFQGGTDTLVKKMVAELQKNGCEVRKCALVEGIDVERATYLRFEYAVKTLEAKLFLCAQCAARQSFRMPTYAVRLSTWSAKIIFLRILWRRLVLCVIIRVLVRFIWGSEKGETIPNIGDLVFTSKAPEYSIEELTSIQTSSHTFSVYYPETRRI